MKNIYLVLFIRSGTESTTTHIVASKHISHEYLNLPLYLIFNVEVP